MHVSRWYEYQSSTKKRINAAVTLFQLVVKRHQIIRFFEIIGLRVQFYLVFIGNLLSTLSSVKNTFSSLDFAIMIRRKNERLESKVIATNFSVCIIGARCAYISFRYRTKKLVLFPVLVLH